MMNPGSSLHGGATRAQWIVIAACSLFAVMLRLYYVNVALVDHPIRGDATSYYAYAWNLLNYGVFSHVFPGDGLPVADSYRDPAYPFLMAAVMRLSEGDAWYLRLLNVQALLGASTVFFALLIGRRWLSWPWLVAAGGLMAIWPHAVTSASYLLTETLTGFLVTAGIWLACLSVSKSRGVALTAGLVLGIAGLANAILLPVGVILGGCLALRGQLPKMSALALFVGSLLLPGAWAVRNAGLPATEHVMTMTSTGRAIQNFVQGSWPEYHQSWQQAQQGSANAVAVIAQIDHEIAIATADPMQGVELMLHRMSADPQHYLLWYARKPLLLWGWNIQIGAGDVFIYPVIQSPYQLNAGFRLSAALAHALNPALLVCATVFCVVILIRPRAAGNDAGMLACATVLMYVTAVYWLLQSEPRYSIAFRPLQVLAAMTWLGWAWAWTRRHAGHWASGA